VLDPNARPLIAYEATDTKHPWFIWSAADFYAADSSTKSFAFPGDVDFTISGIVFKYVQQNSVAVIGFFHNKPCIQVTDSAMAQTAKITYTRSISLLSLFTNGSTVLIPCIVLKCVWCSL